jgi:lipopolysaccharide export system permease protein
LIATRYVAREVYRPFLAVVAVLLVVFAVYTTGAVLSDVVAGALPAHVVLRLVLIKSLIALEVLLPVAFYFSAVIGLGRLHAGSELLALAACGLGEPRVLATVLRPALVVALVSAVLSVQVRPWAFHQLYLLKAVAEAEFDVEDLEPGRLFISPDSRYAVYAVGVDHANRKAREVVAQMRHEGRLLVIEAQELYQPPTAVHEAPVFEFSRGRAFRLDREGTRDTTMDFGVLTVRLEAPEPPEIGYRTKMQSTADLSAATAGKGLAEFQWRLSTPVSTLLLAALAVPLSRAPPRRGRFLGLLIAMLAFAVFYALMLTAKNLVQDRLVGPVPGLWWPIALLALATLALLLWPQVRRRWHRRPVVQAYG